MDRKVEGVILGMQEMKAIFRGVSPELTHLYFDIPKDSPMHDDKTGMLERAAKGCEGLTGLKIKVKKL